MNSKLVLCLAPTMLLFAAGCGGAQSSSPPVELTVSAAASVTEPLQEIQQLYESENNRVKLHLNFGGSGALQQQIEQGAQADIFLSASPNHMNALVDRQLIDANGRRTLLMNELVVVVPADGSAEIGTIGDLSKDIVKTVAIGIPESVPAGGYAKEALDNAGLWDALSTKTVQGKDVRQVLQYVETGNADAGFVYKSDALTSEQVEIAFPVDPLTYAPVEYPVGIVKATEHHAEAKHFFEFLHSREALEVFVKYGFSVPE